MYTTKTNKDTIRIFSAGMLAILQVKTCTDVKVMFLTTSFVIKGCHCSLSIYDVSLLVPSKCLTATPM